MTYKKNIIIFIFLFLFISLLCAENIRGPIAGIIKFDGTSEQKVSGKLESLVGIEISGDISPLVQGIRLKLSGGDELSLYRNSFALFLYENLDAPPSADRMTYRGTQSYMRFLDFGKSINFLIPLSDNHTLSPDRSSFIVSEDSKRKEFPLILSILPITKGIPDKAYSEEVSFIVSPVYYDKGSLQLNVLNNKGVPVEGKLYFQVDGKMVSDLGEPRIFDAGFHTLVIRSDTGVEESLQFSLSAGEKLVLDHILQLQYPTLKIDTVEGMTVFLDGKPIPEEDMSLSFEIQPGDHIIQFQIGGYQLSREFSAEMQDAYRITMIPEILLDKH